MGARSTWSMGGPRTDVEQQLRWDYRLTLYRLRKTNGFPRDKSVLIYALKLC